MSPQIAAILTRVLLRMRLASAGVWFHRAVLALAALYALGLIISRGLGLLPDVFALPTLLLIPAVALLVAMLLHRRPTAQDAARAVDQATGAKDLFLTATLLERAPGEYRPLVLQEAQSRAASVRPAAVVPFQPWNRAGQAAACVAALALAILGLPQFDPFGYDQKRLQEQEKRARLEESVQITQARAAEIEKRQPEAEHSREVDLALEELKKAFTQMKPEQQSANQRRLNEEQREIGKMWERAAEEKLRQAGNPTAADQKFVTAASERAKAMEEELKQGKTDALQREAQALKDLAKKLAQEKDPATREQMRRELESRLGEMSDALSRNATSPALTEALSRAAQQLAACNNPGLAEEAAEAMSQTMELSEQELKSLAQTMRDAKALENALKAIQAAKMANSMKNLDGQGCKSCSNMEDYAHQFMKMCQGGGKPGGQGEQPNPLGLPKMPGPKMAGGGKGIGEGGPRPENPVEVGFKSERSESALTAGKLLMEWKNKGVSDSDAVKKDYVERVGEIKRGASEAILQEEIPPGYHDAIKRYFDQMDQPAAKAGSPAAGSDSPAAPTGEPASAGGGKS